MTRSGTSFELFFGRRSRGSVAPGVREIFSLHVDSVPTAATAAVFGAGTQVHGRLAARRRKL